MAVGDEIKRMNQKHHEMWEDVRKEQKADREYEKRNGYRPKKSWCPVLGYAEE